MIFARRALQRVLNEMRAVIGDGAIDALASRLNQPGKDRLAAMWELVILHALSKHGALQNEAPLPSGRRPDVRFANSAIGFTADVAAVSDDGLDKRNPVQELSALVEKTKTKLGLKIGGMDLQVGSKRQQTRRGSTTDLALPARGKLREFVRTRIEPQIREQIEQGKDVIEIAIVDEAVDVRIRIDPRKSPYTSISHASYDVPTIKTKNPLYNALRAKGGQLRGASGLVGVIVGDGDSRALADLQITSQGIDAKAIAEDYLRQNSSVHFVLLLSVNEERRLRHAIERPARKLSARLVVSKTTPPPPALDAAFKQMLAEMPPPIAMPVNAALRARESRYDLGFQGGYAMSGDRIKISARELLEVLAGRRTVQETNAWRSWRSPGDPPKRNAMLNPFERRLQEGRLPAAIALLPTDENEADHWIEIQFGDPDPAISPFK